MPGDSLTFVHMEHPRLKAHALEPDARMVHFIGGLDHAGRPVPMAPSRLREVTSSWPVTSATPDGVAELLRTSRNLFVHGFFVYEFLTVGSLLALQAVEASLKVRLESGQSFAKLIDRAASTGLISEEAREQLHAGRELRNAFSHPDQQVLSSFGMAGSVIASSHKIVAHLFA